MIHIRSSNKPKRIACAVAGVVATMTSNATAAGVPFDLANTGNLSLEQLLTADNWLLLQGLTVASSALFGAALYALIKRSRRSTPKSRVNNTAQTTSPSGSLWRGLCHYTAQESGASLVAIHQPSDVPNAPWALREQWTDSTRHPDLQTPALAPMRITDARIYGAAGEPLPRNPQLQRAGIVAGISVPMLGDNGRIIGMLTGFFDQPLRTTTPPPVFEQTASLLASLSSMQNLSPLDFDPSNWSAELIDKIPAAISVNTSDGIALRMNDRYLAMFGQGELDGDDTHTWALDGTLSDLERPDAIENLFKAESELHRRKACVIRELVVEGEEQPRSLCYVGVPLIENNRLRGYVNMVLDPTESSDALALPRSLEQRALATVQCLEDAIISTDNRGTVRYINPAACTLLCIDTPQAIGLQVGELCQLMDADSRETVNLSKLLREDFGMGPTNLDSTVLRTPDGREIVLRISCSPVRNTDGIRQGSTFLLQDVTQQRRIAETLIRQANLDQLTGLENRHRFTQNLEKSLRQVRRGGAEQALLYIDLDKFKLVNDSAGHIAGDALLKQLATLISTRLREGDHLARLGGDEFGVLVGENAGERAQQLAKQLVDDLSNYRFTWQEQSYDVRASIGIALVNSEVGTALELLQRAVVACQTVKDSGHWNFLVYGSSSSMPAQKHKEMQAVSLVRDALENNRFRLFAQPIVAISDRCIAHGVQHFELLIRMLDEDDNIVSPGAFMPAAERYGMMPAIDRWVIHYALEACAELQYNSSTNYELGINLSGESMSDPDLLSFVKTEFARHNLRKNSICFEITETAEITDMRIAQQFIAEMQDYGCTVALDDFGSGLSSFTYLKELPVDYLKIDGSFVKDITRNSIDRSIVEGVLTVGQQINTPTIAEFVEDEETVQLLRSMGVDYAQGWHTGKPRPLSELLGSVQA